MSEMEMIKCLKSVLRICERSGVDFDRLVRQIKEMDAAENSASNSSNYKNLSLIQIDSHAFSRFKERWPWKEKPNDEEGWETTLRKRLAHLREIFKSPAASLNALLKYHSEKARYFVSRDFPKEFVFVISDKSEPVLLTVESRSGSPKGMWLEPQ